MGERKGPIQKSPLPFKHATKICHKNVTLELLGWFPIFFQGAAVFVEFGEYITCLEEIQCKKHKIIDSLPICLIIKARKFFLMQKCKA